MTTHESDDNKSPPLKPRGADRRVRSEIKPPPFVAAEGAVEADRRSPVDRRASWVREYTLHLDKHD